MVRYRYFVMFRVIFYLRAVTYEGHKDVLVRERIYFVIELYVYIYI